MGVLGGPDLAAELVHLCQGLLLAVDEAVGLGEELVLQTHAGDPPLLQLAHQPANVVEVAVAGIPVEQNR